MATIPESLAAAVQLHRAGELGRAEHIYREVLRVDPCHPDAWHLLGVIAHQGGKHDVAVAHIRRALASRPQAAAFHSNLGTSYKALGRLQEAVASYERAIELQPQFAEAHNNLGNALKAQGRLEEAVASYTRALEIKPDYVEAHNNLATALQRQEKLPEAEAGYKRALQLKPDYVDALANLAALYERVNRFEEAASTAAEGLRLSADHPHLNLVAAKCLEREGRHQEAINRLVRVRSGAESELGLAREISFQLGRLYDRTGETARAFAEFSHTNRLAIQDTDASTADKQRPLDEIDALSRVFTDRWVGSWSDPPPMDHDQVPVFVVGFPRSGTTLLDMVLDSHRSIQTLEEKPAIGSLRRMISDLPGGYPGAIRRLTAAQIERLRAAYFRIVDESLERQPGRILLDKLPLNTVNVGLILRVFPAARFIMAVRHPCDVCLSCFMQNFRINDAMASFFTIEDAAVLYANVMNLWRQYRRLLPHPCHVVRYEDLVDDFEGETRRLLEFLGLEWDDAVLDYAGHARRRGMIHTPSYGQVTEPIYRRARYRWRRYAEQLQPVMGLLEPFIEYFGYGNSEAPSGGRSM